MSDKNDYELVQRIVESKLYDNLPNEVPYNLKVELEYFETSREGNCSCFLFGYNLYNNTCIIYLHLLYTGNIHIVVLIYCNTPRIEKLVMGKKGRRIKDIAQKSEQCLRDAFMNDVFLKMVISKKPTNSVLREDTL